MFFLNKHKRDAKADKGLFLYRCGVEVLPEQFSGLYKIIEKNLPGDKERFSKVRSDVYQYTFGTERPFADIKADIIKAYNEPYIE